MSLESLSVALSDRYTIERELGQGGMATVYLAHDIKHDRKVAIKVLKPELAAVIGADRFLAEIRTTANLQHPHILPLHDSGDAGGFLFYVMPFIEGVTVRDRIAREHQLPVSEAVRIATEVASALDYAHRHGVIHRDIKPENILLHDGSALVADFGIALAVSTAGTRMTETGMSLGTPHYMSPEQAMGEREITARSDVYALGCVTYEMLVGEPPFTGPTAQAIIARVMTEEPRRLTAQRKSIPRTVEAAVLTAVEKLPGDRFASAREFATALGDVGAPSRPGVFTARGRFERTPMGVRAAIGLLSLAVLVLSALAFIRRPAGIETTPVSFTVEAPIGSGDNSQFGAVTITPDGGTIAFEFSTGGSRAIYLRHLGDVEAHPVPGSAGGGTPTFSPDGKSLAFTAGGKWLKVLIAGGRVETIGDAPTPTMPGATWTVGGDVIFTGTATGFGLQRIPAAGGAGTALTTTRDQHALPVALPDGKSVVFVHWGPGYTEDDSLAVASLATAKWHTLGVLTVQPLGMADGWLYYITADGSVMAAPFDLGRGAFLEKPVVVDHGIQPFGLGGSTAALSANGTLAAQRGPSEARLVVAGPDGSAAPVSEPKFGYQGPQYSPDGKRLAFSVQRNLTDAVESDIWVQDEPGGSARRLTSDGGYFGPVWTPDGKHLIYRSQYRHTPVIMMQDAEGATAATTIYTAAPNAFILDLSLTPDGRGLVYTAQEPGKSATSLYYLSLVAGSAPELLPPEAGTIGQGRVSADGEWLIYTRFEDNLPQIVLRPFRSAGPSLQIDGGSDPRWVSPTAISFVNAAGHLIQADLQLSQSGARVTRRSVLFPSVRINEANLLTYSPMYDFAPGGRLVFVKPTDERIRLVVTTNWSKLVAQSRKQP